MLSEIFTNKDFFGRAEQLNILKERVKSFNSGFRQNVAILGRPLIGKTFLIHSFFPYILSEHIIPVYVQVQEEPFDFFAQRFCGSLLYQYLKFNDPDSKKDDLKILIKNSRKPLPKTINEIEKLTELINKKDFDSAYDILLNLTLTVEADSGQKCAVIIEEFDKLANYKLKQPFSVLGKKIMGQRNTFYVVTSSTINRAKQILREDLQLLFGNFETLELKEFDFATSKSFLSSRLASYNVADKHLRFLIGFTEGNPFYLTAISSKLKELLLETKKRKVTTVLLERSIGDVLFNPHGQLNQHFTNVIYRHCINKNGVDILSILVSISEGNYKLQSLAVSSGNSYKELSATISDLQNGGLIERTGVFNRVADMPLRFWLKSVCYKKRINFGLDPSFTEKTFIANIKKISADFAKESKKDLYEKITDLLKTFSDEIVEIDQKRCRLPRFSDVSIRIIGENGPYIIGRAKGGNWIFQIRERKISEKNILDFLKDSKVGKYKFQHKVLIVLNGMDENAKLLAKDNDIWVLDLNAVNLLLDLYGKHKVIIY